MTLKSQQPAARRRFLQNASAGAVGAVARPSVQFASVAPSTHSFLKIH